VEGLAGEAKPRPSSTDFIMPPPTCTPLFSDQAIRRRLLQELPTLDEISIAARHKGDESRGVWIAGADVASGPGARSTRLDTNKGKGKVVMAVHSDDVVSSDDDHPLQRRRRLLHNNGCPVSAPPSRTVTDPGGCLHAMSRLICSGLSRGGTRHAQRHRRGGDSFKGCCR
jgi:hypothetical protein